MLLSQFVWLQHELDWLVVTGSDLPPLPSVKDHACHCDSPIQADSHLPGTGQGL